MINIERLKANIAINKDINSSIIMDGDMIRTELDKLNKMLEEPKNKYDKANLEYLIDKIEKLSSTDSLKWSIKRNIYTPNTEIFINKEYKIDMINSMMIDKDKYIIIIDTDSILKGITYNYTIFELGKTTADVSALLSGTTYLSGNPLNQLIDKIDQKDIEAATRMIIRKAHTRCKELDANPKSPFYDYEEKKFNGYFDGTKYKNYYSAIKESMQSINSEIFYSILNENNFDIKLIRLSQYDIVFMIDKKAIEKLKLPDITIQLFDRKFIFETKSSLVVL